MNKIDDVAIFLFAGLTQLSQKPGWCVTRKRLYCVRTQANCHSTLRVKYASCVSLRIIKVITKIWDLDLDLI